MWRIEIVENGERVGEWVTLITVSRESQAYAIASEVMADYSVRIVYVSTSAPEYEAVADTWRKQS